MDKATRFITRHSVTIAILTCTFLGFFSVAAWHWEENVTKPRLEREWQMDVRRIGVKRERKRVLEGNPWPTDRSLKEIDEELERLNDRR